MYTRVVVDASVWVSRFTNEDPHNIPSKYWMANFIASKGYFVEPSLLRIEIASSISRRTKDTSSARYILNKLAQTPRLSILPIDESLVTTAIDIASDLQLRAGDTLYVALAFQQGVPLVSWDKEQLERASRIIPTFTPETYPF